MRSGREKGWLLEPMLPTQSLYPFTPARRHRLECSGMQVALLCGC